jgi:putative MATE family efflux protein
MPENSVETNLETVSNTTLSQPVVADVAAPAALGRVLALLREALAASERDYTSGPLGRAILLLAVPMVLEMAMESAFAICDVFFVSRLGVDAVASVGLTEAMLTVLYAVAGGLGMATTATVARRIGERRPREATSATIQAIALGLALSAVIGVVGAFFAPELLRLMGASPAVLNTGAGYARVVVGSAGTVVLLFVINAAFRGAGDAALAMRTLWLANAFNIVLDPCFIFGLGPFPELGVTGAAVATAIGRGVGVAYQLTVLLGGRGRLRLGTGALALRPRVMARLVRLSLGGVVQYVIANASWLALVRIVGGFGSAAVAGYTIAIRIVIVTLLPAWGLAGSAATLVGQNLGAGKGERAERAVWIAGWYNVAFMLVVAVGLVGGAAPLVKLFAADDEVVRLGVACLRWIGCGCAFYGLGMVVVQALNGAGDTATPTVINLGCYWLLQLPLAYVLAYPAGLGAQGVFIAVPIAESLLTIVAVVVFRRGRWRSTQV